MIALVLGFVALANAHLYNQWGNQWENQWGNQWGSQWDKPWLDTYDTLGYGFGVEKFLTGSEYGLLDPVTKFNLLKRSDLFDTFNRRVGVDPFLKVRLIDPRVDPIIKSKLIETVLGEIADPCTKSKLIDHRVDPVAKSDLIDTVLCRVDPVSFTKTGLIDPVVGKIDVVIKSKICDPRVDVVTKSSLIDAVFGHAIDPFTKAKLVDPRVEPITKSYIVEKIVTHDLLMKSKLIDPLVHQSELLRGDIFSRSLVDPRFESFGRFGVENLHPFSSYNRFDLFSTPYSRMEPFSSQWEVDPLHRSKVSPFFNQWSVLSKPYPVNSLWEVDPIHRTRVSPFNNEWNLLNKPYYGQLYNRHF